MTFHSASHATSDLGTKFVHIIAKVMQYKPATMTTKIASQPATMTPSWYLSIEIGNNYYQYSSIPLRTCNNCVPSWTPHIDSGVKTVCDMYYRDRLLTCFVRSYCFMACKVHSPELCCNVTVVMRPIVGHRRICIFVGCFSFRLSCFTPHTGWYHDPFIRTEGIFMFLHCNGSKRFMTHEYYQ